MISTEKISKLKLLLFVLVFLSYESIAQSPEIERALRKKLKKEQSIQTSKSKKKYANGQVMYKGKYYDCPVEVQRAWYLEYVKVGKWVYYHPNGEIERVENYNKPKSCYDGVYRHGKWEYKNQQGITYLEEFYENDTLVSKEIEVYSRGGLERKLIFNLGVLDTVYYQIDAVSVNLVKNPGFETFKSKPISIVNTGHSSAEDLVADWTSPDSVTPDYYSEIRYVKDVPNHISSRVESRGSNVYMGIILYHNPSSQYLLYSEHLQTRLKEKLVKGQTYCVKLDILLSQNAGYYIDQFGALLADSAAKMTANSVDCTTDCLIEFNKTLDNRDKWERLCSWFVSDGTERHLTIGNFQKEEEINKVAIRPYQKSSLDINESAYYLIDNVEVISVSSPMKCECDEVVIPILGRQKVVQTFDELELTNLEIGNEIILNNVQLKFNQFEVLNAATEELNRLKNLLRTYIRISIMIGGHTDNIGSDEFNLDLSEKRAKAVSEWLIMNEISSDRLKYRGFGSSKPLVENSSDKNRAINRRVEFRIFEN
ncbi:MAG: OOP family OmpA-OmpF porin [Cyclobacteriaceae bacterium]|jgi:outer membrane protein OmpA-like peptidoglycan-associated protein